MEWRCTWCGKPHDENDPPCDECGHHKFEKAVEQFVASERDEPRDPVWVCAECGRRHQKHSPPCSRCGNHALERRDPGDVADELTDVGTRWRDVLEPRYVAGYVAVAVLLVAIGLGLAGVYDLPGTASGPPAAEDVPGNATTAGGHSLASVEDEFVAVANERRTVAGDGELTGSETLATLATDVNRQMVRASFGEGDRPDLREVAQSYDASCDDPVRIAPFRRSYAATDAGSVAAFAGERAFAVDLYDYWVGVDGGLEDGELEQVGVDVHVVGDDRTFVTVAAC